MDADFWHERWKNGQIGFHQDEINPYLMRYWSALELKKDDTVFVPMAGKSKDILWFMQQDHPVIAVELSEQAIVAFFEENHLDVQIERKENFSIYYTSMLTFYCGDYFNLSKAILSDVKAVFDRAALIALPPDMRKSYVEKSKYILPPSAQTLLITMEYRQSEMSGPPFSVLEEEVHAFYDKSHSVSLLETFDVLAENPQFVKKGLTAMVEKAYSLKPSS